MSFLALAAVFILPDGYELDAVVALAAIASVGTLAALPGRGAIRTSDGRSASPPPSSRSRRWRSCPRSTRHRRSPASGSCRRSPGTCFRRSWSASWPSSSPGPLFGVSRRAALGLGYATATFGVLIGADLLREPPLYGTAVTASRDRRRGTSDLLYLSGLLALGAGVVALPSWDRGGPRRRPGARAHRSAHLRGLLRRSLVSAVEGRGRSVRDAHGAVEGALGQAYTLAAAEGDTRPAPARRCWGCLRGRGRPGESRRPRASPTLDPLDATRAWLTARWIVRFARTAPVAISLPSPSAVGPSSSTSPS